MTGLVDVIHIGFPKTGTTWLQLALIPRMPEIASLGKPDRIFILDQYDVDLDLGFVDRMHLDEYGYEQIIDLLDGDAVYTAFLDAVRDYYAGGRPGL